MIISEGDELLDLVDENDVVIGTVLRNAAHVDPLLFHREIAVIIFNSKNQVLLQQRSLTKKVNPGLWTISVAGHVEAGKNPKEVAEKETEEELGIKVTPIYFDTDLVKLEKETHFCWNYYCFCEATDFTIQQNELTQVKWVDVESIDSFNDLNEYPITARSSELIKKIAQELSSKRNVSFEPNADFGLRVKGGDELLDLVDQEDNVIGTILKSAAHKNPALIHREVDIIILNSKNQTLLQQRSFKKRTGQGRWETAGTGHVKAGEYPLIAMKREVREELGINVKPVFYKKIFNIDEKNSESKFYWMYYAYYEGKDINFDQEEVSDVEWVDLDKIHEFAQDHDFDLEGESYKSLVFIRKFLKL
jgi:isopentenyl-diphosphate delta-isomerase